MLESAKLSSKTCEIVLKLRTPPFTCIMTAAPCPWLSQHCGGGCELGLVDQGLVRALRSPSLSRVWGGGAHDGKKVLKPVWNHIAVLGRFRRLFCIANFLNPTPPYYKVLSHPRAEGGGPPLMPGAGASSSAKTGQCYRAQQRNFGSV